MATPRPLWEDFLYKLHVGLLLVDAQLRLTPINTAARDLFQLPERDGPIPQDEIPLQPEASASDPSRRWPWERLIASARTPAVLEETVLAQDPRQRLRTFYCRAAARDTGDGNGPKALVAIDDRTTSHAAEEERRFLHEFLDALPFYIGIADLRDGTVQHNEALRRAQGPSGRTDSFHSNLTRAHDPASLQRLRQEAFPTAERERVWQGETVLRHRRRKTEIPVEQLLVAHHDEHGCVVRYSTLMRDLSWRRRRESEIERLLNRDPITGLPNRALFHDRIEQARILQDDSDPWMAVIVCDIQDFSSINDSLGQERGDRILAAVGERLGAILPQSATVARLGADEFGVLLPRLRDEDATVEYAERIVDKVGTPLEVSGEPVYLGLRAGISVSCESDESPRTLVEQASAARRHAKRTGSRYRFFSEELTRQAREQVYLARELRRALDSGDLVVHYQPQVDLRSGEHVGCEALVRWHHPQDGWIPPGRFIPAAETAGMILQVGERVLELAGGQFRRWRELGTAPGWLAVNMAATQMDTPGWSDNLLASLDRIGLAPRDLELEITERLLVERPAAVAGELAYLRRHGVRVAVDDFGTGYSSLNYLTELPVDRIKIDRSFTAGLPTDPRKAAVVEAIVTLGHRLGMSVLAEGVETEAERQALLEVGCPHGQGFLFARPATDPFAT